MAICKLCNTEKTLIDSHIFPEFMYDPMYDENHQFKILSNKTGEVIKEPKKGIYEKLLCKKCDNEIIGKYEDHAAKVIFGDGKKEIEIEKTDIGLLIHGIDYTLFKLFQISLLWRASISTRPEIIRISLGPHSERMRNMLFTEDPGEVYEYGVVIYLFPESSKEMKDLIIPPSLSQKRIEGNRIYRAIFNGLFWTYFVSNHSKYFSFQEHFLSKDGTLPIINSGKYGEQYVFQLAKEYLKK
jgi:hypothetical protein